MARAIRAALAEHDGDILAFLPGMAEIRRTEAALDGCGALVLPLHGDLPPAEQDRALRPAEARRVVLATSIAETSLTVPGVRIVVDGGWRRAPRLDPATGLTRLATLRISRAAADQRAGRAGREAPGVAIRLWIDRAASRPAAVRPAGNPGGRAVRRWCWTAPPGARRRPTAVPRPAAGRRAGRRRARCWRSSARWTPTGGSPTLGRRMAQLGAHPRLAAMMLAAETPAEARAGRRPRRPAGGARPAARARRAGRYRPAAAATLAHRRRVRDPAADRGALPRIRRSAPAQVPPPRCGGCPRARYARPTAIPAPLHRRRGFPDRIAQRRGEPGSFRLSGGGGAKLPRDRSARQRAKLLAVAALEMKPAARIRLAAPLDPDALPPALAAARDRERWRPASTRSPARCCRAGAGGWARWCWPTARCPPIPRRPPRRWPAAAAGGLSALPWTDAGAPVAGARRR